MLPKVATHILHTTSRAAASIHHQSHTIRNVLSSSGPSSTTGHLAPWNTPGSSNWGNSGPGHGSTKHNTGSRFHHGYTGAGRAVTQATNTLSSTDGSFSQTDETEELPKRSSAHSTNRTRIRSHSLSIPNHARHERGEKLGILETVQLHARSRHIFAPAPSHEVVASDPNSSLDLDSNSPRPVPARRNSTSTPLSPLDTFDSAPPPIVPPVLVRHNSTVAPHVSSDTLEDLLSQSPTPITTPLSPTDPTAPQTTRPPLPDSVSELSDDIRLLNRARDTGDYAVVVQAVRKFCQTTTAPSVREYNAALEAIHTTRRPGESLQLLLETYNGMLKHSLLPNTSTYLILIDALTQRDLEVQKLILTLENRLKYFRLTGHSEVTMENADRQRIKNLQKENNFGSAMTLFEAVLSLNGNKRCMLSTYTSLLRSCAAHGSVDNAIHVFAQIEKRGSDCRPSPHIYRYMIQAYVNGGRINGAQEVFNEYLEALKRGDVHRDPNDPSAISRFHLQVWNQMIEAYFRSNQPERAIGLVEQMMNSSPDLAEPSNPPPVGSSTFTAVLSGFCQMGDIASALVWFDRLLQQNQTSDDPFETTGGAMKPDPMAWSVMFDALATHGMINDLNRLFSIRLQDSSKVKVSERQVVFAANMAHLTDLTTVELSQTLEFLFRRVITSGLISSHQRASMVMDICGAYIARDMFEPAIIVLTEAINSWMSKTSAHDVSGLAITPAIHTIHSMQLDFTRQLYEKTGGAVPFNIAIQLARIADKIRVMQLEEHTPFFLQSYTLSRNAGTLPLQEMVTRDWELLMYAAVEVENATFQGKPINNLVPQYAFGGIVSLLDDIAKYQVAVNQMNTSLIKRTIQLVVQQHGPEQLRALTDAGWPASLVQAFDEQTPDSPHDSEHSSPELGINTKLRIDSYQTKTVHAEFKSFTNPTASALNAFAKFRLGIENGKAPSPATIGLLIQNLGRVSRMEQVHYVYTVAQDVLRLLETNKAWQADAWFMIEDSMIIALAHHGDVDGAHAHRMRILEQGGVPSADAYGALIYNVKDTTDDASNAMALFQESQERGVTPNQYFYNNIISKLARARKADYALELFQQMKASNVQPSSVTYGAVIGACARVGDVHSAESLFAEMVQSKNFKPRVPPYNTMMQMYTTTKPNRERALYFYHELRKAQVAPTAHTYKLLMDAYGAIEPVDIDSMEKVFKSLQEDEAVALQGSHFATLINAYGCVQKNLDKAIDTFNSIPAYSRTQPVDAVVFEAMINVLVAHRRTNLIPEYIAKMESAGVHMTAYIANFLIKGYALAGDIDHARKIFESLEDPAEGMAAPNNHSPHDSSTPVTDHPEPVYREPSTWEAMVRAELGSGNRQRALDLLERLRARQYPEAVYNRISGIMVDHSMILS